MTAQAVASETVTELLPHEKELPLRGLYLEQHLLEMATRLGKTLVVTTFLADQNGVIAKAYEDRRFEVPRETRNASDWRLSQELMAQADVLIVGGSYLKRAAARGSHAQDILHQFEPGAEFADLGEWRLRSGYGRRSPDVAVITRHLDFDLPQELRDSGRSLAVFTTDGMASSAGAKRFTGAGAAVIGGGELGVNGEAMIDYLHAEMGARVVVMASGPRVFELLVQPKKLDLLYLTQVQRMIPFEDPSSVLTLLPGGESIQDLKEFNLTHQYLQERAVAGDGAPISQDFFRYDSRALATDPPAAEGPGAS